VLNDANQAAAPVFTDVLDRWKAEHPGIDVEWIRPQGTVSLTAMVAAGTPPNVFALGQDDMAAFAASGAALALDPYLKRDRFDAGEFFPTSIQMGKAQAKQFSLPRAFNCGVVYTNLSLFDTAGVPRPPEQWGGPRWSWAEFQDAARRLSVASDDPAQARFGADLLMNNYFWAFVFSNGGEMFNADMTATRLNEPPAVQALQYLSDLVHRSQANPTPAVKQALGGRNVFQNGQVAMQWIGASNLNLYWPIDKFTWDWRPLPSGKTGARGWGGGVVWSIAAHTPLLEESWSLLQHLTGEAAQTTLASQYFPPRKKAVQAFLDGEAKAGRPPKNRQMVLDAMQNAVVRPGHVRYNEVQDALDEELAPVWAQGASVQTAADNIKRRVDAILQGR
jgi:multiple sugar transport system substrate-binding protein